MPAVSGSPTQIATYALTAADLAGAPDDQFKEGDLGWVASLGQHFVLQRGVPPFASNNTTLVSTYSGNGYWMIDGLPGQFWGSVTDWYINAVTGLDTNAGNTAAAPLKTFAEIARRLEGLPLSPQAGHTGYWGTIHVLSAIPNSDPPTFRGLPPGSFIYVKGDPAAATVVVPSVIVSVSTACNPATNTYWSLTTADVGFVSWTPYIGKTLRIKTANGGNQARVGALAQIVADMGAKQARILQFRSTTTRLEYSAAVGDVLEIVDLPIVSTEPCVISDNSSVQVNFDALAFELDYNYSNDRGCSGYASFFACNIRNQAGGGVLNVRSGFVNFYNTLFYSTAVADYAELDVWSQASFYAFNSGFGVANGFGSNAFILDYGSAFTFYRRTLFQSGANAFIGQASDLQIQEVAVFDSVYRTFTLFAGVTCNIYYAPNVAYVFGTTNAAPIFYIGPNVHISYLNTTQFVSTDTGAPGANPIQFVGYAQQTWANLAAGPGIAKTAAAADTQSTFTLSTLV